MYNNEFIKIAPANDAFTPSNDYASDVLAPIPQDIFTMDPVTSPGYYGPDPLPPVYQDPAPVYQQPVYQEPVPAPAMPKEILLEAPGVTVEETADGGSVVELKDPADPAEDKGKKILVLGALALGLYFILK